MRNFQSCLLTVALVSATLGCSELKVYRVDPSKQSERQPGKIAYFLPRSVISTSGVLTLKKCALAKNANGIWEFDLEIDKSVSSVITSEPDPNYQFYVDYMETRSIFKESNVSIDTYQNKTLQGIGNTMIDQAGPLAVATLSATVNLLAAVAVPGASVVLSINPDGTETKTPKEYCSDTVLEGLKLVLIQREKIKAAREEIQKAGQDATLTFPEYQKISLAEELKISAAQAEIATLNTKYKLVRTFTNRWIPTITPLIPEVGYLTGEDRLSQIYSIDIRPVTLGWFTDDGQRYLKTGSFPPIDAIRMLRKENSNLIRDQHLALQKKLNVNLKLILEKWSIGSSSDTPAIGLQKGVVIRDPAVGVLHVCKNECDKGLAATPDEKMGKAETADDIRLAASVAQLGRVMVLPQKSVLLENSILTLKLNADGSIANLGYKNASTASAGVSGVSAGAKDYMSGVAARNTAITAQNTAVGAQNTAKQFDAQFPGIVNKALAECFTNEAAVLKAGGTPIPCQ